jgi:hypothetical protein
MPSIPKFGIQDTIPNSVSITVIPQSLPFTISILNDIIQLPLYTPINPTQPPNPSKMMTALAPILFFLPFTTARDIIFPPSTSFQQQPIYGQHAIDMNGDIDISTGSAFAGLMTYANLPYVHCLAAKEVEVGKYDIAILGAPFDTVGSPPFPVSHCTGQVCRSKILK